jgi:hypothetical protein
MDVHARQIPDDLVARKMTKKVVERRAQERTSFEFRSVQLRARLAGQTLDILNIGPSGLLGRGSALPKGGVRTQLSIAGLGELSAEIIWNRGELVGLSFSPPIDPQRFRAFLESANGVSGTTALPRP